MLNKGKYVRSLHLMMLLPVLFIFVYNYLPMLGAVIAFERYNPGLGIFKSKFVGFENFMTLFRDASFLRVLYNTISLSVQKMIWGLLVPLIVSLLLNEVRCRFFKRSVQTLIYMPYFLSWIVMASIIINILSPNHGLVNQFLELFGIEPIFFLGDKELFPGVIVTTHVWKEFGWNTIIFLSALSGIDPGLYEAAAIDGAGRWKQLLHVTLPGIASTIILVATLNIGNILNAGFDQVYNLYSSLTMQTGDILDTFVYRVGMEQGQFGIATAAGLFKSVVSCFMLILSYKLAEKLAGYKVI